jgi:hypothetical protein
LRIVDVENDNTCALNGLYYCFLGLGKIKEALSKLEKAL